MTLAALLYLLGAAQAWRRAGVGRGVPWGRLASGLLGFAALAIAVSPPLEGLAALYFSAHMGQHLLLMLVAAPLLVNGVPLLALLWLLPPGSRRRITQVVRRNSMAGRAWRMLGHPLGAWSAFVVLLWAWHLPAAYQAAVANDALHLLEHLSLTGSAVLFWWVILQPLGRRRLAPLAAPLYLFLAAVQGGVLGAMITLSPQPWYGYYERVATLQGLSALADQQLAGLLMWVPPSSVYLAMACWMLYRSLSDTEARSRATEASRLAHLNIVLPLVVATALVGGQTSLHLIF